MVDLVESASRARKQDDARLGLENLAQPPPGVRIGHVAKQGVQILDEQDKPFGFAIRKIQNRAKAALSERPIVGNSPEFLVAAAEIGTAFFARSLHRQTGQTFQPEFARSGDLVAFFREHDGEEVR